MTAICNINGYPKTLAIIKNCHWNDNDYVKVYNSVEEWSVRLQAKAEGHQVAVSNRVVINKKVAAA